MKQLESQIKENTDCSSVELMNSSEPKHVEIIVCFLSFGEIDTMNEKYQAEILVEAKWTLTHNDLHSKHTYDPKEDWNPNLYVITYLKHTLTKIIFL
jgi:hypothetical protein